MIIVLLGVSVTLVPKVAIELAYLLKIDHHLHVNSKVSNFISKNICILFRNSLLWVALRVLSFLFL